MNKKNSFYEEKRREEVDILYEKLREGILSYFESERYCGVTAAENVSARNEVKDNTFSEKEATETSKKNPPSKKVSSKVSKNKEEKTSKKSIHSKLQEKKDEIAKKPESPKLKISPKKGGVIE